MKRLLPKPIFWLLLAALLVTLLIQGVNYYMQRPATIEKIRAEIAARTGTRFALQHCRFNLLCGLKLQGATFAVAPPPVPEFLRIDQIDIRHRPWMFLLGRLDVSRLALQQPRFMFEQNADGTWNTPRLSQRPLDDLSLPAGPLRMDVHLNRIELFDGLAGARTLDGHHLFQAAGVALQGVWNRPDAVSSLQGTCTAASLHTAEAFILRDIQTAWRVANEKLLLQDITAEAHGGRVRGLIDFDLGVGGPSYQSEISFEALDLARWCTEMPVAPAGFSGTLGLQVKLRGPLNKARPLSGTGELQVQDAVFPRWSAFQEIARLLNQTDLFTVPCPKVTSSFKIEDDTVTFYRVEGDYGTYRFTASGTIRTDQRIDFDLSLAFSRERLAALPHGARLLLSSPQKASPTLTCHISGTLREPSTNLSEKINAALAGAAAPAPPPRPAP